MRHYILTCVLAVWGTDAVGAGFQTAWTTLYDSSRFDSAVALLCDSRSNALVLVDSLREFALVKYAPDGTALWTNRFDSSLDDASSAFAVGSGDAVCVIAVATTNSSPGALQIVKYAANGSLLWTRVGDVTNAVPKNPGVPVSPAATEVAGNLLVAVQTSAGFTVLKYDSAGTPQWTNTYPFPPGYFGSMIHFGADTNGNAVLVAGLINAGNDRMLVMRLSPTGVMTSFSHEWAKADDFLAAATLDPAGNLYVAAGVLSSSSFRYHIYTAKYDLAGALVWSRTRPPANGHHAVPIRIAYDSGGNVLVTAYETRPVGEDEDETQALTLKYAPSGDELWSARAVGFDRRPASLAVDADDNVYVQAYDGATIATFLIKYRPNGSQAAEDFVHSNSGGLIAIGARGNIYVSRGNGGIETRKLHHSETPSSVSATILPAVAEALPGSSITFTAAVSGFGPFTYDWRYFGYQLGETNATLTITNARHQWGSHGEYTVFVSNGSDWTVSPEAHLEVLRAPSVGLNPNAQYVVAGQPAMINAVVSGTEPMTVSWRLNGESISGATNQSITHANVLPSQAGFYMLAASNRVGTTTSSASTLHVVLPPVSFSNEAPISIPTNGSAMPYPSEILVAGVTGHVVKVTATLHGLTSQETYDLVVLLQAPGGAGLLLMSGVGEDGWLNGVTLTFDDDSLHYVPDESITTGTYRPGYPGSVTLPAPAPPPPLATTFSELNAGNPNGSWRLFAVHKNSFPIVTPSQVAGGWQLTFWQAHPDAVIITSIRRITREGPRMLIEWNGAPGWKLQRSGSLENPQWTDVPGSEGASHLQVPIAATHEFFRLIK